MTKKLQITNIFLLFFLLALSNMAMGPSEQVLLSPTPTDIRVKPQATNTRVVRLKSTATSSQPAMVTTAIPVRTKSAPVTETVQVGNSDWIVVIGLFIVAIIVIPLILKYKEWRAN